MIARNILRLLLALALALPVSRIVMADDGGGDHGQSGGGHGDHGGGGGGDNHGNGNNAGGNNGATQGNTTGATQGNTSGAAQSSGDDHGNSSGATGATGATQSGNAGDDHGNNAGDDHGNDNNNNNATTPQAGDNQNTVTPAMSRLEIPLAQTSAGMSIGAEGHAEIRVQGQRQRLQVEVEANASDGATFQVMANGAAIGSITLHFGEGQLELGDDEGTPLTGGMMPSAVTMLSVADAAGDVVLQAQFGAVGDNNNNNAPAPPVAQDVRKRANLTATQAGMMIGASGRIDARVQGQRQRFKVEIEANVADNTMFHVMANGMDMGALAMRFDEAELEIETDNSSLPAGLDSVGSITMVTVVDSSGATILSAAL